MTGTCSNKRISAKHASSFTCSGYLLHSGMPLSLSFPLMSFTISKSALEEFGISQRSSGECGVMTTTTRSLETVNLKAEPKSQACKYWRKGQRASDAGKGRKFLPAFSSPILTCPQSPVTEEVHPCLTQSKIGRAYTTQRGHQKCQTRHFLGAIKYCH